MAAASRPDDTVAKEVAKMNAVTIYTTQVCPYCVMAKRLLANKGITPVEINVGGNPQLMQDLMQKTGRRTVPQIYIGDQHVGGYDDLVALDRVGGLASA